ncbi:MAG: hypothetical protein ABI411_15855 [Tahibacter sp.]
MTMWCLYRFTFDAKEVPDVQTRDLANAVHEFAEAVLGFFHGNGHWVAASARARNGAFEVWFNLPTLPLDPAFERFWAEQLAAHRLIATRVSGRS